MCLVESGASSGVGYSVGSHLEILSKFFIGHNLLLNLLRNFSLALKDNPKLFKKTFFQLFSHLYQNYLIR